MLKTTDLDNTAVLQADMQIEKTYTEVPVDSDQGGNGRSCKNCRSAMWGGQVDLPLQEC